MFTLNRWCLFFFFFIQRSILHLTKLIVKLSLYWNKTAKLIQRQHYGRQGGVHMGFTKRLDTILNWTELRSVWQDFFLYGNWREGGSYTVDLTRTVDKTVKSFFVLSDLTRTVDKTVSLLSDLTRTVDRTVKSFFYVQRVKLWLCNYYHTQTASAITNRWRPVTHSSSSSLFMSSISPHLLSAIIQTWPKATWLFIKTFCLLPGNPAHAFSVAYLLFGVGFSRGYIGVIGSSRKRAMYSSLLLLLLLLLLLSFIKNKC